METIFDTLGYRFDSGCFPEEPEQHEVSDVLATFNDSIARFVWDAAQLEGNPVTYPEIKTMMSDLTVGGRKVHDVDEVLGLIEAHKYLAELIDVDAFRLTRQVSSELHYFIGHRLVLDAGKFRGAGVAGGNVSVNLGEEGFYSPPEQTIRPGTNILARYGQVLREIRDYSSSVWKRALMYNMAGCFHQYYFDGNKRTSRLMMSGYLLANGYHAISIPGSAKDEFDKVMVEAYASGDASKAINFVGSCYPAE